MALNELVPAPRVADARYDPQWTVELLDLDAYLSRIGNPEVQDASPETLVALHKAHKDAIAFENIDVALGRDVSVELPDIQEKLVHAGRGGYCFEQNLLFAAALERLGFTVTRLLGRVRLNKPVIRYRAHTALVVEAGGRRFLADVGFGAQGLLAPLPFTDGAVVTEGGFTWRLAHEAENDVWVLQIRQDGGWFDLYALAMERHFAVDFDVSNHYTAHHPRSTFTGKLIAMRGDGEIQQTLTNTGLATRHADGRLEQVPLSHAEVPVVLRETFGIRLTDVDAHLLKRRLSTTLLPRQEA